MSNRTAYLFLSSLLLTIPVLSAGCSSSDDAAPVTGDSAVDGGVDGATDGAAPDGATDGGSDAATDSPSDASDATTVCESHGGKCIAVTPSSKCPDGYAASTDECGGVGSSCCTPVDSDGGADAHD